MKKLNPLLFIIFFIHADSMPLAFDGTKRGLQNLVQTLDILRENKEDEESAANCLRCEGSCKLIEHVFSTHLHDFTPNQSCTLCNCPDERSFCFHTQYSDYLFYFFCQNNAQCPVSWCTYLLLEHGDKEVVTHTAPYNQKAPQPQHISTAPQLIEKTPRIRLFRCRASSCSQVFVDHDTREQHSLTHVITPKITSPPSNYACSRCPFTTDNEIFLRSHEKNHPIYKCRHSNCDFTTNNHYDFVWHCNARGKFVCKYSTDEKPCCNKVFMTQRILNEHTRKHLLKKNPFKCPMCEASYKGEKCLRNHQREKRHWPRRF